MKTRDEWYRQLFKEYITPELEERAKTDMDAFQEYLVKDLLADIDADIMYALQFVEGNSNASS